MRIEHVAIWTGDIDRLTRFYSTYFDATAGARYTNPAKGFESCFVSFAGGARLELMTTTCVPLSRPGPGTEPFGLTHFAIGVGSDGRVDEMILRMRHDGVRIVSGPRRTGDGYYEAVVLDPDGNRIELCGGTG